MAISIDFVTDPYAAPVVKMAMLFFLQRLSRVATKNDAYSWKHSANEAIKSSFARIDSRHI